MKENVKRKLALLRESYVKQLPEKVTEIEDFWNTLSKEWNKSDLIQLQRMAHSLHGTASTYGLEQFSQTAENLENYVETILEANYSLSLVQTIEKLIHDLKLSAVKVDKVD